MDNCNTIREKFLELKNNENYVIDKTGVKTLEIVNASFIADEPTIFGVLNDNYISREIEWYMSQSLNINDIHGHIPQIWKDVSDDYGFINSNYGWCIFSEENGSQFKNALEELDSNRNSRRAVMIYNRPSMWTDYNKNGMSDFMCTSHVQYMIRDNELVVCVYMRSNDVVFGYRNDYAWQHFVAVLANDYLGLPSYKIYWNVGSLHVYERHFYMLK